MIEWKTIKNLNNYLISSDGQIKNIKRNKIKSWFISNSGYKRVSLYKNGKGKNYSIHRLVILAFKGSSKLTVNHKNGIKTDNRLENLEYCTYSQNHKHAYENKLREKKRGSKSHYSKLTEKQVYEIKFSLLSKYKDFEISLKYSVTRQTINRIRNLETWKHVGINYFDK